MTDKYYDDVKSDPEEHRLLQQEISILEATELIHELMAKEGVSRADMAARLGTSRSHVTQVLDGTRNMTLRTLSDMMFVLGRKMDIVPRRLDDPPRTVIARNIQWENDRRGQEGTTVPPNHIFTHRLTG